MTTFRSSLVGLVVLLLWIEGLSAECITACKCPSNTLSLKCDVACMKAFNACIEERDRNSSADQKRRHDLRMQQYALATCRSLPKTVEQFDHIAKQAWLNKREALEDGQKELDKLRNELAASALWTTDDAGQMLTYLALVTKTSADLFNDTVGFSGEARAVGRINDIYQLIRRGKSLYYITQNEGQKVVLDLLLVAGDNFNPAFKAAKAVNDFQGNIKSIAKTSSDIERARKELTNQLDIIDAQFLAMQRKIDQINKDHVRDVAKDLFQTFKMVELACKNPIEP